MPVNIDLKPRNQKQISGGVYSWVTTKVKVSLILINMILFGFYVYNIFLERKQVLLVEQVNILNAEIKKLEAVTKKYKDIESIVEIVDNGEKQDINPIFIMNFLNKATPVGAAITQINVEGETFSIHAKTKDALVFNSFINLMVQEEKFESVILDASTYNEEDETYTSSFQITYK